MIRGRKLLLLVTAFLGLGVSGYLWMAYTSPVPLTCGVSHGCDVVRASEYASLLGIPTPFYGIVFYGVLAILAVKRRAKNRWINIALFAWTAAGLLASAWFTYLEAYVIHAWCTWCVVSAILTVIAFGFTWLPAKRDSLY